MKKDNSLWDELKKYLKFENPIFSMLLFCALATSFFNQTKINDCKITLQICLFLIVLFAIYVIKKVWKNGIPTEDQFTYLIIMAGFVLRFVYIIYTGIEERQNDIGSFIQNGGGHLGYIRYIYDNWKMPDFDPRSVWQFYHPPLHHIIAAIWVKINVLMGYSLARSAENIQILTLLYSGLTMVFTDRIMKKLNLKINSRAIVLCILAFFPYFVMNAGAVNNDCLATLLMICAVYYTLIWYENPSMKNIIILAFLVGGSMMAKLSGAMLAPAIAFVFLVKFIKEIKNWKIYIPRFLVFGLISFPIGLWNSVRNMINYDMPLNFVMRLSDDNIQSVENIKLIDRLFDFKTSQLSTYNMIWDASDKGCTYNIFYALMKFASFNEWDAGLSFSKYGVKVAYFMLICMFILTITTAIFKFYGLLRNKKTNWIIRAFLFLLSAVTTVGYISFCMEYPFLCTMNVRYLLMPIIINLICFVIGLEWLEQSEFRYKDKVDKYIYIFVAVFCIFSLITVNSTMGLFL